MTLSASARLLACADDIMSRWQARANQEVLAALHLESLALRDSLPDLLQLIAQVLANANNRWDARNSWQHDEGLRVGRRHGQERADSRDYTMDQMIFEYHILRRVIFDTLEQEGPVEPVDREAIVCAIEQAVNHAATQFSATQREASARLADTLTHDLRGPLTVASLGTQRLMRQPASMAANGPTLGRIAKSIERMEAMIKNLLDVSRIKSGLGLPVRREWVALDHLAHNLSQDLSMVYEAQAVVRTEACGEVFWDQSEVYRLVENLVSNAAHYGAHGAPITVRIGEANGLMSLSVHNEGPPIPQADWAALFAHFHRGDAAQHHKGWGIGLSVVKAIAEAHGGHIGVDSSAEAGTTFTARLPRDGGVAKASARLGRPGRRVLQGALVADGKII